MALLRIKGATPAIDLVEAIYVAAEELDIWECYAADGRYHFVLGGGWSLALSADSADRVRVETCRLSRPVDRMWCSTRHPNRLAGLVRRMSQIPEAV